MSLELFALKLTRDELDDLASAVSFTLSEYERVRKDRAPSFKRGLKAVNVKIWKAIRSKR